MEQLQAISVFIHSFIFYKGIHLLHQAIIQYTFLIALLYMSFVIWRVVIVMVREAG